MAKKTLSGKSTIVLCIVFLCLGFVVGQILPLPIFQDFNLTSSMTRPGDKHNRR